jgi:hypothetical protein
MSSETSIAKGRRLQASNFYITINSNKWVALADQLTPEEEAYFQHFDNMWKSYFNQSPNVWLKFLVPGDNTENSVKSINSLAQAKLQLSRPSVIHAHMLIEVKHFTKVHLNIDKLRAHMEAAMGNNIHVNKKVPSSGKEDLDHIRAYILKEEQV